MSMQLETRNREAFELVTDALEFIDRYRKTRDVARLGEASNRLAQATKKDPCYFRAWYYDALVDDLSGRPQQAVEKLKQLLNQSSLLTDEVRYNLGLAEYHRYSHDALRRAIHEFMHVLTSAKDRSLQLRAQAGLAQAYAMHMIPQEHDKPNLEQIQQYHNLAIGSVSQIFQELEASWPRRLLRPSKSPMDSSTAVEIRWTAHNAKGMALMYYSDYLPQIEDLEDAPGRKRQAATAEVALSELTHAEAIQARDWANWCDLASAQMRLAYYRSESDRFHKTLELLQYVIEQLRPGYAFAIYEKGRALRLLGEHKKAIECFNAALAVPPDQRDVSERRVTAERQRAALQDKSFP